MSDRQQSEVERLQTDLSEQKLAHATELAGHVASHNAKLATVEVELAKLREQLEARESELATMQRRADDKADESSVASKELKDVCADLAKVTFRHHRRRDHSFRGAV